VVAASPLAIQIHVENGTDVPAADHAAESLEEALVDHCDRRRYSGILAGVVTEFITNDRATKVSANFSGEVNGVRLQRRFSRQRIKVSTISPLVTSILAVSSSLMRRSSGRLDRKLTIACLTELHADIASAIDEMAGDETPGYLVKWKWLRRSKWAVAAIVFLFGICFGMLSGTPLNLAGVAAISGFAALAAFVAAYCLSLALMPADFCLREAEGLKALTRTGLQSPTVVRVLSGLLSLPFAALAIAIVMIM